MMTLALGIIRAGSISLSGWEREKKISHGEWLRPIYPNPVEPFIGLGLYIPILCARSTAFNSKLNEPGRPSYTLHSTGSYVVSYGSVHNS